MVFPSVRNARLGWIDSETNGMVWGRMMKPCGVWCGARIVQASIMCESRSVLLRGFRRDTILVGLVLISSFSIVVVVVRVPVVVVGS